MVDFPTYPDLVGHEFADVDGAGLTHREWMANVGAALNAGFSSWIYGDGFDGALVLHDGDTWVPGNYTDVTIEDGATVTVSPFSSVWPVFRCTGTFTINGTLDLSGVDAPGSGPAGGVSPYGTLAGGIGNGANAAGDGDAGTFPLAVVATGGFMFLSAQGTPMGGAGGDGDSSGGIGVQSFYPKSLGPHSGLGLTADVAINAPLGGSSGGGDSVNLGGAGGSGGAWAIIAARHVVHGPDNAYNLQGGGGGDGGWDGATTGNGNCGGGGGGGGGYWVTISNTVDAIPANIVGTGGAGGAGCGTGTDGSKGDDGFVVHLLNR